MTIEIVPQSTINAEVQTTAVELSVVPSNPIVVELIYSNSPPAVGGAVDSVTGTANQITASPTTGAVVLSLPMAIVTPDSLQVTGTLQVDGQSNLNDDVTVLAGKVLSADVGGDLQGTLPNPTVHRLRGIDIQSGNPADNDVLQYDSGNNKWHHHSLAEAGISAVGHTHVKADITDFAHTHVAADVTDFNTTAESIYETMILDPTEPRVLCDEFLSTTLTSGMIGELGWRTGGGTIAHVAPEADHPGIIRRTGTVNGTVATMFFSGANTNYLFEWKDFVEMTAIVRAENTATDHIVRIGVGNNGFATGAFFQRDSANAYWTPALKNGVNTAVTTDQYTYTTNWIKFKIKKISQDSVEFYVDGVLQETLSIGGGNQISNTADLQWYIDLTPTSANQRSIDIDFFSTKLAGTSR